MSRHGFSSLQSLAGQVSVNFIMTPGLHYRSLSRTIASTLDRTNYIEITPEVPPANAVNMLLDLLLP
jgi:hypothetical protein